MLNCKAVAGIRISGHQGLWRNNREVRWGVSSPHLDHFFWRIKILRLTAIASDNEEPYQKDEDNPKGKQPWGRMAALIHQIIQPPSCTVLQ